MNLEWDEWELSPPFRDRLPEFIASLIQENIDSNITRQWRYLDSVNFESSVHKSHIEVLNETCDAPCDIEGLITSTLEAIESGSGLDEAKFKEISTSQLSKIFIGVEELLTDSGFTNLCKVASTWDYEKLLHVCFDNVIYQKLLEKEEASLTTISAVKELGRRKPELLSKCIIQLLKNEVRNFSDCELLDQIFDVLPDSLKEDIVRAIIEKENFSEGNCQLLQVLSFKTKSALQSIVMFMNSKCDEFAYSQAFARLLVHICKNLQSEKHKEVLLNIIERNRSLLKYQAKKYLTAI